MQQIAASLPTDAAAPTAKNAAGAASASSGAFAALLLGASAAGQGANANGTAGINGAAGTAGAAGATGPGIPVNPAAQTDEDKGGPAAAITAAVMETIERQQKAINALNQGSGGAVPGNDGAAAQAAANAGAPGKALGLANAPGQAGTTPANGAPPPGTAGATPGQIANAAATAAGQGVEAKAVETAPPPANPRADGIPAGAPTTDAHATSEAEAAIKAGALKNPGTGQAAAPAPAPTPENTGARGEGRPAEAPRPVPVPANAQPAPPTAPESPSLGAGGGAPAAGAQTGESQGTAQNTSGTALAGPSTGADPVQPGTMAQPRPVMPAQPVAEQMAVHIQRAAAEGMDRIMIQLNPPQLGRVEVKLEFGHDGRVQAIISADNPDALDTLRQDARALERALADAGVKSDPGSLTFQLRGEGRGGNDQAAGNQPGAPGADPDEADLPEDAAMAQPDEWHDGLIDIRV